MAETLITVKETAGQFPVLPLTANSADFTFGVLDLTDGGAFVADGTEIILVQNADAATQTVTIESQRDPRNNRTGDITTYSMGAGEFAVFHVGREGWADGDGKIHIAISDVDVKVAVIRPKK